MSRIIFYWFLRSAANGIKDKIIQKYKSIGNVSKWAEKIKLVAKKIPELNEHGHSYLHLSDEIFKRFVKELDLPNVDGQYYIPNGNRDIIWCYPRKYGFLLPFSDFVLEEELGSQNLVGHLIYDGSIKINSGKALGNFMEIFDGKFILTNENLSKK